jgi:catechol 2,3-dioxygenase-like lactoylglutathione lyase family enzyme
MLALLLASLVTQAPASGFEPAVFGLELPVADVAAAERAYAAAFGFEVVLSGGELARLEKDGLALLLVRSDAPRAAEGAARVHLNLRTGDIGAALEEALAAGFDAPELEPHAIPIGRALALVDPDGHVTNLIEVAGEAHGAELAVFNIGLSLEPDADRAFVERLGFRAKTRAYLPDALPTEKAGAAELVVRGTARASRSMRTRAAALLLAVEALRPAQDALAPAGFAAADAQPRASPHGRRVALTVPSSLRIELIERSPAQLAFERLCALAGSWEGRSSAGWTARSEIEVIARGSAVLERTNFEAHPGETMLTFFHRDGEALVLTHYCVAGNQPRLVASEIDGGRFHFTFRDATNLATRDVGHMDEAFFDLGDGETFSSKWSFSQGGKTSWMEEIEYRRVGAGTASAGGSAGAGCGH